MIQNKRRNYKFRLYPEDGGTVFLWNFGTHLPEFTLSWLWGQQCRLYTCSADSRGEFLLRLYSKDTTILTKIHEQKNLNINKIRRSLILFSTFPFAHESSQFTLIPILSEPDIFKIQADYPNILLPLQVECTLLLQFFKTNIILICWR
jgi:hypothetical protein